MSGLSLLSGYGSDSSEDSDNAEVGDIIPTETQQLPEREISKLSGTKKNLTSPLSGSDTHNDAVPPAVLQLANANRLICNDTNKKQRKSTFTKAFVPPQVKHLRSNVVTEAPSK